MLRRCIAALIFFALSCSTEEVAYVSNQAEAYERGQFGRYPAVEYRTTNFIGPRPLLRVWNESCHTQQKLLLTPYGSSVEHGCPLILDSRGQVIWHGFECEEGKTIYRSLSVQKYLGEPYLTYWKGVQPAKGIGSGSWIMLDQSYRPHRTIDALNNLSADFHDFLITEQSTAIVVSYVKTNVDLSTNGGPKEGWAWDSVFQEIDLVSNILLFEWRASSHFSSEDCFFDLPVSKSDAGSESAPWDWFHINSVEKDGKGNFLISSRYLHGLAYVNGSDGGIIWVLGGKRNDFRDLSDGHATDIAWQHDAHWSDNRTTITIFDNRGTTTQAGPFPAARGIKIRIDEERMAAELIYEVIHPHNYLSVSQGSMQELPNGKLLIGYGSTAAITEFDLNGDVICDMSFGAMFTGTNASFRYGSVMNYRALKQGWSARPWYEPIIVTDGGTICVSWNGATEVERWSLQRYSAWYGWRSIGEASRQGFETCIDIGVDAIEGARLRLVAYNKNRSREGHWPVPSYEDTESRVPTEL